MENIININEYIRTKTGKIYKIDKIDKCPICKEKEYINTEIKGDLHFENTYHKKDIKNHSKNIIDLVEVGDYVNGALAYEILDNEIETLDGKIKVKRIHVTTGFLLYEKDIKSIVTKEQFVNAEYRLED